MIKLNPSGSNRWVPCPGSPAMELPFPRSPSNPITEAGKAIDWATERVMWSWLPTNDDAPIALTTFLGTTAPNGTVIDDEMIWGGGIYLDDVWSVVHPYVEGLGVQKQLSAQKYVEKLNGPADAFWRSPDVKRIVIWDLKYGYNPVPAYMNFQLICYALGAIDSRTEEIDLRIVQPRGRSVSNPIKVWRLTVPELMEHARTLIEAATEARGPNPRTVAGPWCNYCRAAGNCNTLDEATNHVMQIAGQALIVETNERQLAYDLALMGVAEELVKARKRALQALAVSRIDSGHPVPGFENRRFLGNRQWTKPPSFVLAYGRLNDADLSDTKPCTPAQAEVRGMHEDIVNVFTDRTLGAAKLVAIDPTKAREVFQR